MNISAWVTGQYDQTFGASRKISDQKSLFTILKFQKSRNSYYFY